jgi:predicted AlkP superfamily pyrophosphatase or phosphodiesterase
VFVISWDAARADLVYELIQQGYMPNFANLLNNGFHAKYAVSIDPSLTAPAHNSISTGLYPDQTGIVSNSFHNPNDSFYWYRQGFEEPIDQNEPIWVKASNEGYLTASLFFPGGSPLFPGQAADITIGYGIRDAYSNQVRVTLAEATQPWQGSRVNSYNPPYEGVFVIPTVSRIYVYLVDSTDDGERNYDLAYLNTEPELDSTLTPIGIQGWKSLELIKSTHAGADFLLQEINDTSEQVDITLFHTAVYHNHASPHYILNNLNEQLGFFPAGADSYALEHGWIGHQDYLKMLERASSWMSEVTAWVINEYQPDLLFTWQNDFDSAGHAWLLTNDRQPGFAPELATEYREYYIETARIADQALDRILDVIDLENSVILLIGDHGMTPVHTNVFVNTILEQAGLLKLDRRNYVIVEETRAFAVASGGAVHIYINLVGHEVDGIVPQDQYELIQDQIIELLLTTVDPNTNEPVFQRILRQAELSSIHLDHPNSGDIFAQAVPGYVLDGWRGSDQVFEPIDYYGQHGYNSSEPDMGSIFIAAGAGIAADKDGIPSVSILDYAPTIARLLGFSGIYMFDGEVIESMFISE